jgi:hypothetical protein
MKLTSQFHKLLEDTCQEVLDDDHPVPVDAVGNQENRVFDVSCEPEDESLILGAPCRQGTGPRDHQHSVAVLEGETPLPAAVTRVVREAEESAITGEGVGHA